MPLTDKEKETLIAQALSTLEGRVALACSMLPPIDVGGYLVVRPDESRTTNSNTICGHYRCLFVGHLIKEKSNGKESNRLY